jgi:hypothetical protein
MTGAPDAASRLLQDALAAEQAATYGYGVVGAHLAGAAQAAARTDWVAHQKLADQIQTMLLARGVQPGAAAAAYALPYPVRTAAQARALAAFLEDRVSTAYIALVALADRPLRTFGARQARAAALRAAGWAGRTIPFPGLPASALRLGGSAARHDRR